MEVGVRQLYCLGLFTPHRKVLMMRTGEPLSRAQFRQLGFHVLDRAAHPFQFCVLELLLDECCAHLVVAIDGAVVALSGLVQLDLVILDGCGLELLCDALLYVARCLPNFQKAIVRLVINRISVDARRATGFGVSIVCLRASPFLLSVLEGDSLKA